MNILGISGLYHDSAAALLCDNELVAAAQEERFTRIRHDSAIPTKAVDYCLETAGLHPTDLDAIVFYEKPMRKFLDRFLISSLSTWPQSLSAFLEAVPMWMGDKLWSSYDLKKLGLFQVPLRYVLHHDSHAASAYYPSGFDDATILTVDGVGEWTSTAIGYGKGDDFLLTQELRFPHSLGLLYSTMTAYLGFRVNSGEYKVMGLAPYGEPTMVDKFHELVDLKEDGSFRLRMEYFRFHRSLYMPTQKLEKLFGRPVRKTDDPMEQFHKDCARSLQEFLNDAMVRLSRRAYESFPSKNLVMAGGVALNCVSNSYLLENGPFENIFVQPAAGDAGGALGAALMGARELEPSFKRFTMSHAYYGPVYTENEIDVALAKVGLKGTKMGRDELLAYVAERLDEQDIVGWFQGRMEFGPRALGNRSILADPRRPENRDRVNLAIKYRESFRPFAPSVPEDAAADWFDLKAPTPFMLFTVQTKEGGKLPAVTHLDGSARLQTIGRDSNPMYYDLHRAFEKRTGVPVLINTSFNVRGEPIVCTPENAIDCFLGTEMDLLVLGNIVVAKKDVDRSLLKGEHRYEFAPD